MSLIAVKNLSFAYPGSYDEVFSNVSFSIDSNWKLGFIGRNGRGKTTLLRLLLGQYPFQGSISSNLQFDYFPFAVENTQLTTQQLAESIAPNFEQWQLERELNLLALPEDILQRCFATLSYGEQTKVLLALLFLQENRFLLIDEPTNHLDIEARQVVSAYLQRKKGFILVSHDREFLDNCIDHVISINKADIAIQKGNFSSWWENKQRQDNFELAENERLKGEVKRLEQAAKRNENWSDTIEANKRGQLISGIKADKGHIGHLSAKMMKRAKAVEQRQQRVINEKSSLLKNIESSRELKIIPEAFHSQTLATLDKLVISYDDKQITAPLSLSINQGEKIALMGKNGSGKSSIIKLLLGEKIAYQGELYCPGSLKISYLPQDSSLISGSLEQFALTQQLDQSLFKAMLRQLGFSRTQFDKDMAEFSAGQKKKVWLAKSLAERAHLYLWDEPLNYIDIISRMQIEQLLQNSPLTMMFVEHDQRFCDNVATKVVTL